MIETLITIVIVLIAVILTPFALMMSMMTVVMFLGFIMMPFKHVKLKRKGKR